MQLTVLYVTITLFSTIYSLLSPFVLVPPRWLVEPADVSVERNRHVALHCQAQGVPTPTVVWKKATGLS